jgi:hypothetical protein
VCFCVFVLEILKKWKFIGNSCDKLWIGPLQMSSGPTQCVNVYDIRLYDLICGNSEWPQGQFFSVSFPFDKEVSTH